MTEVKFKKKMLLSKINQDFFNHFHDSLNRLPKDISELVFKFLGFKVTHNAIIKVSKMLIQENDHR
jgi:hypothetical protein